MSTVTTPLTTCIVADDGSGNGICQPTSLPPLPPIIRHDKDAYLEQRLGLPTLPEFDKRSNEGNDEGTDEDSHKNNVNKFNNTINRGNEECRMYMAPSSIPNAGFGMYAGTAIPPKSYVDLNPQIVIPLVDINKQLGGDISDFGVIGNYPWSGFSQGVHLEGNEINILFPNLGMLANSHLGLVNTDQYLKVKKQSRTSYGFDRAMNAGAGSISSYGSMSFKTDAGTTIGVGEELFVDYGHSYFDYRENKWGTLFPTNENYKTADGIMHDFLNMDDDDSTDDEKEEIWSNILETLEDGSYVLPEKHDDNEDNEKAEEERLKTKRRIAHALPKHAKDVPLAAELGAARFSLPNSTKSLDYLQEHGICLDNMRKGRSTIPQAGNGAFATKNLEAMSIIAPAPLVPIERHLLHIVLNSDGSEKEVQTNQLLLNYCFGHPQSSLLFFPYSSTVQYINHNNVNPNAFIRWSDSSKATNEEMFDKEVGDVYTGVGFDIIAHRDIGIGEEITIDYGIDWTKAWYDHVESWEINDDESRLNPQKVIETMLMEDGSEKKPFRTMKEQEENPYPYCIRTACYTRETKGAWSFIQNYSERWRICDVIERSYQNGHYWYTAKMHGSEYDDEKTWPTEGGLVTHVPQDAIFLNADKYCSDLHLENAFRHEIGVPEGLFPDKWLDLKDHDVSSDNHGDIDNSESDEETAEITCDTTAGQFTMFFRRDWSPHGYDRVIELFRRGYYEDSHFFRVVPNFLTQFGMSYTEDTDLKAFAEASIEDDPQLSPQIPFVEGTISFAGSGPNSRTSHLFISYTAENEHFGTMLWETPVGYVIKGMDIVRKLNSSYGDMPPWGNGPEQPKIQFYGRRYIEEDFPNLDKFLKCVVQTI